MIYDINLIPKSKIKTSGKANSILLVSAAAIIVVLLLFGFYLPYKEKLLLKSQIKDQNNIMLTYSDTEGTFSTLQSSIDEINATDLMMDKVKSNNLKMTETLDNIENNMPRNIITKSMTLDTGMLTIEGTSPSFTEIANFIVHLRSMDNVSNVSFMSAQTDTSSESGGSQEAGNTLQLFNFTVYVEYSNVDAFAQLLAVQTAIINTPGQEAVPNETD